jgi:hypothetical protein
VAYYVPLGPRGTLLRVGTFLIDILGGLAYSRAYRRRDHRADDPVLTISLPD